ncbi:MAG: cyclic peptide export ABC transporter [Cyclobacteriaceae bacterium]
MNKKVMISFILLLTGVLSIHRSQAVPLQNPDPINEEIENLIAESDIPGMSIVMINGEKLEIRHIGYADLEEETKVDDNTLFELGSNSKAFTALAMLKLADVNQISLDQPVTDFIPWFNPVYEGAKVKITLRQLMQHTSGIPFHTISMIPTGAEDTTLVQTVRAVSNVELASYPGQRFEYATVNYDVIGLVIERVSGKLFDDYLEKELFKDLDLNQTFLSRDHPKVKQYLSEGYKIGFFEPREYEAPVFRGNNPAGYVISSAGDMAKWLRYQMGLDSTNYASLIEKSHERDDSVTPQNLSSYAYGWFRSIRGDGQIYHGGLNPNFTSHVVFRKNDGLGVVVLANSNSSYTRLIADNILSSMAGEAVNPIDPQDTIDKDFSIISMILGVYILLLFAFIVFVFYRLAKNQRQFKVPGGKQIIGTIAVLLCLSPFLIGLYLLPDAMNNFTWDSIRVWTPVSFEFFAVLSLVALGTTFIAYILSMLLPDKNEYVQAAPKVILLSVLSGLANTIVILLITSSLQNGMEINYLLFYFGLVAAVYLICRKVVQTDMIYLTRNIIYNLRMKMTTKIFSTSYENFEKIDRGRIYAIMDYDIVTLGQAASTLIAVITSIITAIGVFFYMATLSFWATIATVLLIVVITVIYNIATSKTNVLFNEARETHSNYMKLLNGMIDGFRQLSIHKNKKFAYKDEIADTTNEYREKINTASVKFVNAFLVGESLLLVVLSVVAFAVPRVFTDISSTVIMSFVILLLYLIGPINSILNSIPQIIQFKISWNKIQEFIKDIPATIDLSKTLPPPKNLNTTVEEISIRSLSYTYPAAEGQYSFSVGPVNLTAEKGELIFIIGGNGSGKTTFSKILTGLYQSHDGGIFIEGKQIPAGEVGEYFSTVFHPLHLFERLYDVDLEKNSNNWKELLTVLELQDKVSIEGDKFSTINLSGGQRKRLALLQCFLENKPIYLFDEWAADQDPEYRKTFYRELLPKMKAEGKIVFAITHDDHYFDVADKVIKLEMGNVEFIKENSTALAT